MEIRDLSWQTKNAWALPDAIDNDSAAAGPKRPVVQQRITFCLGSLLLLSAGISGFYAALMPHVRVRLHSASGGRLAVPNTQTLAGSQRLIGTVVSARGAVLDVRFGTGMLPEIDTAVNAEWGRRESLALEVPNHVDPATVRGIALQAAAGLARGTQVDVTRQHVAVPVGNAVLGRLLDVLGIVRDRGLARERAKCRTNIRPLASSARPAPPATCGGAEHQERGGVEQAGMKPVVQPSSGKHAPQHVKDQDAWCTHFEIGIAGRKAADAPR